MKKKVDIIFVVVNLILLVFWYFFLKHQTIWKIDDFFYSKIAQISQDQYNVNWDKNLILLKIDKEFFDKMWVTVSTFHRWYYAKILEKIQNYWAKNVVFDVYFGDLKYEAQWNKIQSIYNKSLQIFDNDFQKQIKKNVVLGAIPDWEGTLLPADRFLKNNTWIGQVKSHTNKSDINDWVYSFLKNSNNENVLTLWYEWYLNRLYNLWKIDKHYELNLKKWNNIFSPDLLEIKTSNPQFYFKLPLSVDYHGKYFVMTPFLRSLENIKSYSIYDILTDEDDIYKTIFAWKTVFIGATDETLNDIKLSYLGFIPGVMFHVNHFLSIYSWKYMYTSPVFLSFAILFILFVISYIMVVAFKDEKMSIISFVWFLLFLFLCFYYLFVNSWILIPIWTILLVLFFKLVVDILHILFINQERKKFVTNLFSKYIWDRVLEKKWTNKWNIADKKEIFVMFSDIAWFTNISENLQAKEVIDMLNSYFDKTNTSIIRTNWFIDKYIWDAIMAFWEDTDNADRVLDAIIQMQKVHPQIISLVKNKIWKDIKIATRIWLHFGEAVIWDVWDIRSKISYTAIWDNINLASRIEWINKYYNTKIIISEQVYEKIKNVNDYAIRLLDKIVVKWKSKPLKIYELMSLYKQEITQDILLYIKDFETAVKFYFQWNFEKSKEILNKLEILSLWAKDPVLPIFKDRVDSLLKNKPENWDWVWKFDNK